ncbi:MAG: M14 family metallopeptidase [Bacteroidetes bacterium]|nr:M14 family metallopeptidase [Bacteroidota bacterium]
MKENRFILVLLLMLFPFIYCSAQQTTMETFYEKSGFRETPRYDKTIRFCKQLAQASPWVHYTRFGTSLQGRDLPLVIVDKRGNFDPQAVHNSNNAVVLIQACIHAGEPDGKDAGLMLIRDIVISKKYENLLDNVTLLFIPILNVDGHERFGPGNRINQNGPAEAGWRTNALNLNLNRDYLKAETPEIKSWLSLYQEWLPDFFIDCHVTDGADFQYVITYGMETCGDMDPALTRWQSDEFLRTVDIKMKESGYPIISYVSFRNWHDPRSGLESWATPPMLSQGYCMVQNRPSLLIESHMLKDYKTRVTATYEMLRHSLEVLNRDYRKVIDMVRESDKFTVGELRKTPFPIQYEMSEKDSVMIDFLGFEYTSEKSALSGGQWFKYTNKPAVFRIPYFNKVFPSITAMLPEAYLIPPEWKEVIDKLSVHGIQYFTTKKETRLKVSSYRFREVTFKPIPYEGRQIASFKCDTILEEVTWPVGTIVVDMNQRSAKVIAYLLEPMASTSLAYWGFFNTIFEQKEYAESYVMEKMAREMMEKDPDIVVELQKMKTADPKFAQSPEMILNWFYERTPYWDHKFNVYPIGKTFDKSVVEKLKN